MSRPTRLTGKAAEKEKKEAPKPRPLPAEEEEQKNADDLESVFGDAPADENDPSAGTSTSTATASKPRKPTAKEAATEEAAEEAKAVSRMQAVEDDGANERAKTENTRTEPIDNRDITGDTDPFAAPGIPFGAFLLKPSLEQGLSWTSNASNGSGSALFSETTLRLGLSSNWARHSATINAYGTWLQPIQGSAPAEPKAGIDAELRLDLEGPFSADTRLAWELAREAADSAVPVPSGTSRALVNQLNASASIAKDEGFARLSAKLAAERKAYGDATLGGGGTLSQQERNYTYVSAVLRGGVEVSPALVPFAEAEIGRRFMDQRLDTAGYERSGTLAALRAGISYAPDEKFDGEIAVGWLRQSFDDSRLAPISGLSLQATANWSPQRDTTISLKGSTSIEGTTTAGRSGSMLYTAELTGTRRIRSDLSVEGSLQASLRDYTGSSDRDTILAASAGFTWWLSRYLGVSGRVRQEMLDSTIAGNSSRTTSAFLRIRVQR